MKEKINNVLTKIKSLAKKHLVAYLTVFACGILLLGTSFAWFTKSDILKQFQIVVNDLTYTLQSDALNSSNQVTVPAGETLAFDILVTSNNPVDTKYQMVYSSSSNLTDVEVGYNTETTDPSSGTITANGTKTISVVIKNNSSTSVTIQFNIRGGLKNNNVSDIILASADAKLDDGLDAFEKVTDTLFASENLGSSCTTYNDGTDTFLVGQCSNNYVWYSGKLWRVVLKNNATGAVKLVTDNAITSIPYNASGNTAFKDSYMDQWLNQEFLPTLHDYEDYLVINSVWDATADSSSTPTRPAGTTTVERTVGLLNAYEYYTTSAQSGGLATFSNTYLRNNVYWWLMTPLDASNVWVVNNLGYLSNYNTPISGDGARPSVNLKSTIQIDSGSGTQSNPYILKGDQQEIVPGTTLLSTRYSGEYVTFNNELYRIVGVENGLTKITAVDKPSSLASNVFNTTTGTGTSNFANATIKADLETYYHSLQSANETAFNMIEPNTTWYLGTVSSGTNYKASICVTVDASVSMNACDEKTTSTTASIALPRVGEMFSSQITRGTKASFWTLTPYSTSYVRNVTNTSSLTDENPTKDKGARPSMYLKSNVVIASNNTGNGTYEYPYSLSVQ